ncbi:plasmid partitioning protein RepB (plasmid) [Aminobacter sp. SR38]|jgi:ParB family chromosome partitioning protein|uniref:plasmid partitioning protein RepB n=1 Tax=Hyphomicrobiales TaxID=356 RepID=UPI00178715D6|nr:MULTISPECIES: plasmid partitioning protein RepB [Hyphomicrobiales]MCZ7497414.1 plasmid partitioning protein RepB [Rhizobium rhizogenes]MCZ7501907.1 plasmid partitioning protein RepB [Rhizobium rhizogenes]QOF75307.1 plasmid partitioning protein RepB [Aminobacter sp. SR38]
MSKQPGRKSILANFASYTPQQRELEQENAPSEPTTSSSRVAGVIGATQRTLAELREEREELKAQLEASGELELDPELVDPSPFPDRLIDDDEEAFEAFKLLIASEGQMMPILVRRHPADPARYQVSYGHRRLRAARELGLKVKAKVGSLDDRQLVIAQGMENSARQDLTWAEKALFAAGMETAGVKARDIRAALAVDDPELARFRTVCRIVPEDVMRAIGRAPKAGRTRWTALAKACSDDDAVDRVRKTLADAKGSKSDDRFVLALNAAAAKTRKKLETVNVVDASGSKLGTANFTSSEVRITVDPTHAPGFAEFVRSELPALVERYKASRDS